MIQAQYKFKQPDTLPLAKKELNYVLDDKDISGIPLLVLANKVDISPHMEEFDIIKALNLDYIVDNAWAIIPISALYGTKMENVVEWLLKVGKDKKK